MFVLVDRLGRDVLETWLPFPTPLKIFSQSRTLLHKTLYSVSDIIFTLFAVLFHSLKSFKQISSYIVFANLSIVLNSCTKYIS